MFINKAEQLIKNEIRKLETKILSREREIIRFKKEKEDLKNSLNNL